MAIFAPQRMVMYVDDIKFDSKEIQVSQINVKRKDPTPTKNKVDIISPMPLEDLQTITDSMNQFKKDRKTPHGFDELGKGHFGTVFGYKDFAIKFVSGGQSAYRGYSDEEEIQDAHILRQLQDIPSIPRLYATIDNEIIIMERVRGMTLRQYHDQMEDVEKMNNFIDVNFLNAYREIMKDLMMIEMMVSDLHMDNVMVCERTGLPRIIDVGLFRKMDKDDIEKRGENREKIMFECFYNVEEAIRYAGRMKPYIKEKKYPFLLEERKAELLEEKESRKRYKAWKMERRAKQEQERDERRAEFHNSDNLVIREGGIVRIDEGFRRVGEGIRINMECREPKIFDGGGWFKHVGRFSPMIHPLDNLPRFVMGNVPEIGIVKHIPQNAQELIAMKKENSFKQGLQNMFKAQDKAFIHNQHQMKFLL